MGANIPSDSSRQQRARNDASGGINHFIRALVRFAADHAHRRRVDNAHRERHVGMIGLHVINDGLDPLLVVALIQCESSFDLQARSPVGAIGLMQVMPETGKWVASQRGIRLRKKAHLFDSELNLEIGSAYLASLLRRFGTLETALLAYNAGPGAARKILADRSARGRLLSGYPKRVAQEFRRLKKKNRLSTTVRPAAG